MALIATRFGAFRQSDQLSPWLVAGMDRVRIFNLHRDGDLVDAGPARGIKLIALDDCDDYCNARRQPIVFTPFEEVSLSNRPSIDVHLRRRPGILFYTIVASRTVTSVCYRGIWPIPKKVSRYGTS
jgi:hypothetical protein